MTIRFYLNIRARLVSSSTKTTGYIRASGVGLVSRQPAYRSKVVRVSGRIRSSDVIEQLARLISLHCAPRHLRSDNGTEFVSNAVLKWLREHRIDTAVSDPGKPWQNGLDESFNGKFRDECLNMEWFRTRAEARVVIETWRKEHNQIRPHSSLNYQTPNEYISILPKTASQQAIL